MPNWPPFGILCPSSSAHLSHEEMIKALKTMLRDLLEEVRLGQIDDNTSTSTDIEHEVRAGTG
jgi:hypothetical protein